MHAPTGHEEWVEREYDWATVTPTVAILKTIASYEQTTPTEIAENLDTHIITELDTDALDNLLTSKPATTISFPFADYHVQLQGNTIKIAPLDAPAP